MSTVIDRGLLSKWHTEGRKVETTPIHHAAEGRILPSHDEGTKEQIEKIFEEYGPDIYVTHGLMHRDNLGRTPLLLATKRLKDKVNDDKERAEAIESIELILEKEPLAAIIPDTQKNTVIGVLLGLEESVSTGWVKPPWLEKIRRLTKKIVTKFDKTLAERKKAIKDEEELPSYKREYEITFNSLRFKDVSSLIETKEDLVDRFLHFAIRSGDLDFLQYLVGKLSDSIQTIEDKKERTPSTENFIKRIESAHQYALSRPEHGQEYISIRNFLKETFEETQKNPEYIGKLSKKQKAVTANDLTTKMDTTEMDTIVATLKQKESAALAPPPPVASPPAPKAPAFANGVLSAKELKKALNDVKKAGGKTPTPTPTPTPPPDHKRGQEGKGKGKSKDKDKGASR